MTIPTGAITGPFLQADCTCWAWTKDGELEWHWPDCARVPSKEVPTSKERLIQALRGFAQHSSLCQRELSEASEEGTRAVLSPCTCGLDQLLDATRPAVETSAPTDHVHSWDGEQCHYCHFPRRSYLALECERLAGLAKDFDGFTSDTLQTLVARNRRAVEPACDECHGTGQVCVGYSGRDDDGNAPVMERCPACGYGEPTPLLDAATKAALYQDREGQYLPGSSEKASCEHTRVTRLSGYPVCLECGRVLDENGNGL